MRLMFAMAILVGCGHSAEPVAHAPEVRVTPSPDAAPSLAALLARLDQVAGSFSTFDKDPVLVAILAIGEPAVEPLIDILETDQRTSQAVFDREREFEAQVKVPVYRIAYWLLGKLVATRYFGSPYLHETEMARDGAAGRTKVAAEIRVLWQPLRGVPIVERWYRVLASATSSDLDFFDAATKILEFVEDTHFYDPADVTKRVPLAGDSLRIHASPSVIDLLVTRIPKLELYSACELARLYGRWDPSGARALAAAQMTRAIAASGATLAEGHCIRALTIVRIALGDTTPALDEYAAWIGGVAPPTDLWEAAAFEPMWQHPGHPSIVNAADQIFGATSRWLPLIPATDPMQRAERIDVIGLPLHTVPAFKRHAIAALADRRIVGSVTTLTDRTWSYAVNGAGITSTTAPDDDPSFPPTEAKSPVRVADYYAFMLAKQTGAPRFELYWTLAQRDRVIAQTIAWLMPKKP